MASIFSCNDIIGWAMLVSKVPKTAYCHLYRAIIDSFSTTTVEHFSLAGKLLCIDSVTHRPRPSEKKMDSNSLKLFGQIFGKSLVLLVVMSGFRAGAVEPTVYQLGDGGAIAPHLSVELGTDNNPLRSINGSQETLYLRLQPSATYLVQRRNNRLSFGYAGDFYQYFEEFCQAQAGVVRPGDCLQGSPTFDKASYQDHTLSLDGFLEVSKRLRASLQLSQRIEHQPLGTGLSSNRGVLDALTSPDYWNIRAARAQLSYGAFQARGEVRVGISLSDRELNTELDVNLDAQSSTSVAPFARLLYRIGTRTQLFAGVGFDEVRGSVSDSENLERDISRLSFGAELDSNSVTSGSVSLSQVKEDFLGGNRDLTYLALDVNLVWRPRRFSTVTFSAGRQTESGIFDDDISLTTTFRAEWVHFWRDRFNTRLRLQSTGNEDLDEFSTFSGTDRNLSIRLGGSYNVRRWLDIGGFVRVNSREGSEDARDFDRTVIGITANGTI